MGDGRNDAVVQGGAAQPSPPARLGQTGRSRKRDAKESLIIRFIAKLGSRSTYARPAKSQNSLRANCGLN